MVKIYPEEKILKSPPPKLNFVNAAIKESKYLSTYTENELIGSLIAHEERMKKILERSLEEAFQTKFQVSKGQSEQEGTSNRSQLGRGHGCSFFGGHGRGRFSQRS